MARIAQLVREVRSLKREIKKSYLFRKRIYTVKEASMVRGTFNNNDLEELVLDLLKKILYLWTTIKNKRYREII